MARLAVAATLALTMIGAARPEDPQPTPTSPPSADSLPAFVTKFAEVAAEAGVDVLDLAGAVATTQMDPRAYLCAVGEGPCPKPAVVASTRLERLADCIIMRESRGYAGAVNPGSGASGLGQFLGSTWKTTPQGKAGLSVFDPVANRAAVVWMLSVGRGREFATLGGC